MVSKEGLLGNKAMRLVNGDAKDFPLCATCLYGKQKKNKVGTLLLVRNLTELEH
jgi:hypothetical protein